MLQLIYVSTATRSFEPSEIHDLVDQAATLNLRDGITGLLLFNGRNFLQLLEGESGRILDLMARLRADPRHDGITIVDQHLIAKPNCSDWGMRFVPLNQEVARRKADLNATLPPSLAAEARQLIVSFAGLD